MSIPKWAWFQLGLGPHGPQRGTGLWGGCHGAHPVHIMIPQPPSMSGLRTSDGDNCDTAYNWIRKFYPTATNSVQLHPLATVSNYVQLWLALPTVTFVAFVTSRMNSIQLCQPSNWEVKSALESGQRVWGDFGDSDVTA